MKKLGELMNKFIYSLKTLKVKDKKLFMRDLIMIIVGYIILLYFMGDIVDFALLLFNKTNGILPDETSVSNLEMFIINISMTICYIIAEGFSLKETYIIKADKK